MEKVITASNGMCVLCRKRKAVKSAWFSPYASLGKKLKLAGYCGVCYKERLAKTKAFWANVYHKPIQYVKGKPIFL